jgi:hypothetical protein
VVTVKRPLFQTLTWNEAAIDALGKQSDVKLAKQLGIDNHTVQAKRRALGIAPWQKSKLVHERRCIICGKPFNVVGGRLSQMRKTCPPVHRFTRAGRISDCHAELISRMVVANQPFHKPKSLASVWRKTPGMKFLDRLDA